MKYLTTGIQLSAIIFFMFFMGWKIDNFLKQDTPYITLAITITTILLVLLKLVIRVNKRK